MQTQYNSKYGGTFEGVALLIVDESVFGMPIGADIGLNSHGLPFIRMTEAVDRLPAPEREAVLWHEYGHYASGDLDVHVRGYERMQWGTLTNLSRDMAIRELRADEYAAARVGRTVYLNMLQRFRFHVEQLRAKDPTNRDYSRMARLLRRRILNIATKKDLAEKFSLEGLIARGVYDGL